MLIDLLIKGEQVIISSFKVLLSSSTGPVLVRRREEKSELLEIPWYGGAEGGWRAEVNSECLCTCKDGDGITGVEIKWYSECSILVLEWSDSSRSILLEAIVSYKICKLMYTWFWFQNPLPAP